MDETIHTAALRIKSHSPLFIEQWSHCSANLRTSASIHRVVTSWVLLCELIIVISESVPTFLIIDTCERGNFDILPWTRSGIEFTSRMYMYTGVCVTLAEWLCWLQERLLGGFRFMSFSTNQYPPSVVTWKVFQPPSKTICLARPCVHTFF